MDELMLNDNPLDTLTLSSKAKDQSELKSMIRKLELAITTKDKSLDIISDKTMLLQSLRELDSIVGMNRLKDTVALQVKHLISMKKFDMNSKDKKLSVIFYGPPGTGKSSVGKVYAKILYSLGYLKRDGNVKSKQLTASELSKNMKDNTGAAILILFLIGYVFSTINGYLNKYISYVLITIIVVLLLYIVVQSVKSTNTKPSNVKGSVTRGDKGTSDKDIFRVVSKHDLVGGFLGQTTSKTNQVLEESRGKVLFIDEAYSICSSKRDMYGKECLDAITYFLTENPDSVVILAGYKEPMLKLFAMQKGLPRRCMFVMECDPYTGSELYEIFRRQMAIDGFNPTYDEEVANFFEVNAHEFVNYGGDTERLLYYSQLYFSEDNYSNTKASKRLNIDHIRKGFDMLVLNNKNSKVSDHIIDDEDVNGWSEVLKKIGK